MKIQDTPFEGLYVIEPTVYGDDRGYFFESFREDILRERGISYDWKQDNEAFSHRGALRGLHYQLQPFAQAKLVRVVHGEVQDIVLDIRSSSPTYGKYFEIILSAENKKQLLVPHGFAHGYLTLSETALFLYKCDRLYNRDAEYGVAALDVDLQLPWRIEDLTPLISEKDTRQPAFGQHKTFTS